MSKDVGAGAANDGSSHAGSEGSMREETGAEGINPVIGILKAAKDSSSKVDGISTEGIGAEGIRAVPDGYRAFSKKWQTSSQEHVCIAHRHDYLLGADAMTARLLDITSSTVVAGVTAVPLATMC